jgi:hypothetical protein
MISHSSVQQTLAGRLHKALAGYGSHPKLDNLDIASGERWRQTLAWWLSACQTAVVLLSRDAIASPWVRYELSVLSHRELTQSNMQLVLVFLGISRDKVVALEEFEPFQLGDIQSHFEFPSADLDDEAVDDLARQIHELAVAAEGHEPPVERLVARVVHRLRAADPARVAEAHDELDATADDPWLRTFEDEHQGFARTYCSTPLAQTYRGLQRLAQDPELTEDHLIALIDFNVMNAFDSKAIEQMRRAADGTARRALVTASTRAELVDVAVQTLHELHGTMFVHRFEVNGAISGLTPDDIAKGLGHELRSTIRVYDQGDPGEFLDAMAHRGHPVFALLTSAAGITKAVLARLEADFPSVVFLVLSSPGRPMPELADALEVERTGPDIDHAMTWAEYMAHERDLANERSSTRRDLLRVKRGRRP